MLERVGRICAEEGLRLGEGAGETLARVAGGDMRRAITSLQSAARLGAGTVGSAAVLDVAGVVPDAALSRLRKACQQSSFEVLESAVLDTIADGHAAHQVLLQLASACLGDPAIRDTVKARLAFAMAAADKCLTDGADGTLQLLRVCAETQRLMRQG